MDLARWRKRSTLSIAVLVFAVLFMASKIAAAGEVMLVPPPSGRIGAWLALGPINAAVKSKKNQQQRSMDANMLMDADESSLVGKLGRQVTVGIERPGWRLQHRHLENHQQQRGTTRHRRRHEPPRRGFRLPLRRTAPADGPQRGRPLDRLQRRSARLGRQKAGLVDRRQSAPARRRRHCPARSSPGRPRHPGQAPSPRRLLGFSDAHRGRHLHRAARRFLSFARHERRRRKAPLRQDVQHRASGAGSRPPAFPRR